MYSFGKEYSDTTFFTNREPYYWPFYKIFAINMISDIFILSEVFEISVVSFKNMSIKVRSESAVTRRASAFIEKPIWPRDVSLNKTVYRRKCWRASDTFDKLIKGNRTRLGIHPMLVFVLRTTSYNHVYYLFSPHIDCISFHYIISS